MSQEDDALFSARRLTSLNRLQAAILSHSNLSEEQLEDAAIELTFGIELCRGELHLHNPRGAYDPYEEFLAFASDPGLDYSNVDGSEIGDLLPEQMYLAVAWSYLETSRFFASSRVEAAGWTPEEAQYNALSYEFAARQLVQDVTGCRNTPH